jgi:hypothetical protein
MPGRTLPDFVLQQLAENADTTGAIGLGSLEPLLEFATGDVVDAARVAELRPKILAQKYYQALEITEEDAERLFTKYAKKKQNSTVPFTEDEILKCFDEISSDKVRILLNADSFFTKLTDSIQQALTPEKTALYFITGGVLYACPATATVVHTVSAARNVYAFYNLLNGLVNGNTANTANTANTGGEPSGSTPSGGTSRKLKKQ